MAQVRFYPTDLRRKSASHTLLMAQVPPLKTDLLHSSHPPAPLTLQACTALPHPPAPEDPLSCQAPSPGTEQRRRTQPSAAATISRNRPLAERGSGAGEHLLGHHQRAQEGAAFLPETGLEHGPLLPKCRLLSYQGRSPSASPACLIPRADVVLQENAANVLLAEL